ncbi:hypothetical protein NDU88_001311 [Pleurodeles waltl]|uniref:Uncharacterized protein n=1 Tax=Pleurodeles waltl TaxID=8319 RepID=A0AAV7VZP2_PLEWA|nr:hypothetical protein NDU88_001311 [Pleurodeles waltl]
MPSARLSVLAFTPAHDETRGTRLLMLMMRWDESGPNSESVDGHLADGELARARAGSLLRGLAAPAAASLPGSAVTAGHPPMVRQRNELHQSFGLLSSQANNGS